MTDKEYFAEIRKAMDNRPEVVSTMKGSFQFDFTSDGCGLWYMDFGDPVYKMDEGELTGAKVRLTADWGIFSQIVQGKIAPMKALIAGKLKLKGDATAAMQLEKIFSLYENSGE